MEQFVLFCSPARPTRENPVSLSANQGSGIFFLKITFAFMENSGSIDINDIGPNSK